ncbi:hypothetical protein ACFL27_24255 [candidate division CSSED10-310 bacterium]|uniref:Uncharacterized protein n=1 Tax=candidate division CSSED10-310 bacterium TaxID=2855610 RepID=A0ABV6Z4G2_UNCC1
MNIQEGYHLDLEHDERKTLSQTWHRPEWWEDILSELSEENRDYFSTAPDDEGYSKSTFAHLHWNRVDSQSQILMTRKGKITRLYSKLMHFFKTRQKDRAKKSVEHNQPYWSENVLPYLSADSRYCYEGTLTMAAELDE